MGKYQIEKWVFLLALVFTSACGPSFESNQHDQSKDNALNTGGPSPEPEPIPTPQPQPAPNADIFTYCPMNLPSVPEDFNGRPVLRVCPPGDSRVGCNYNSIQAAVNAATNGVRIEIVKGNLDYQECAVIPNTMEGVEIIGVCGRPILRNSVCQKKGYFLNLGKNMTFTHLEITGVSIPAADGGNGAAIRDQSLGGLSVRYSFFHHNQNGILGGAGDVLLEWSKFEANGSAVDPGYTHNIYMGSEVTHLVIRNSLFLRARYEGNNLKSRAQKMTFECSVSASLDGVDSREMDISEGGEVLIKNSLVQQGANSSNSNLIGFATESGNPDRRHPIQSLTIQDSLMINDKGNGSFVQYNAYNNFKLTLNNLTTVGPGSIKINNNGGTETLSENNTQSFGSRAGASLPVVSNDHMDLPKPPGCPNFEYY